MKQQNVRIGLLQWGIILLTIATALVHFSLLFPDVVFILNGLGYLTLLAALYLPLPQLAGYRRMIRWALLGYTALTIVLWLIMGSRILLAYIDKTIEVILIVLLWLESRGE
ncbi:MAG: hypothetical protein FOGNACKC_00335 [Anaerolineae bacterium]|nr:hypothetical protein [Anaerolineae bacterium]